MLDTDILKLLSNLKAGGLINNMQEGFAFNIYDINNDVIIKLDIIIKYKAEVA
jgi:hypothetical protein